MVTARVANAVALEVVRGQDNRRTRRDGLTDEVIDQVAAFRVESSVRLVEKPQLGPSG